MYKIEELNRLNVHELRALARDIGVKSPTTKNVVQLTNEIIAISEGSMSPHKSNMGRPPKSSSDYGYAKIVEATKERSLADNHYEIEPFSNKGVVFCADGPEGINGLIDECMGVVRITGKNMYIQNYLGKAKYVIIGRTLSSHFVAGDIIVGKYKKFKDNFGIMVSAEKVAFGKSEINDAVALVKTCKDTPQMYEYINNQNGNNIVVAVESNLKNTVKQDDLFFYTKECEDVVESYNVLLDVKKSIQNLCEKDESFAVYLIDAEYIYFVLTLYYSYKKLATDVNAGQYFKEILSAVNNSKNGKIVLFEKEQGIRSSYLDIIINKYCKKA